MTKSELFTAFWEGTIGEVEFFEVGSNIGVSLMELSQVITEVREEDGVI